MLARYLCHSAFLLLFVSGGSAADNLEERYQQITTAAFEQLADAGAGGPSAASISSLLDRAQSLAARKQGAQAIALIAAHTDLLKNGLAEKPFPDIIDFLLDNQALLLAQGLLEMASDRADPYSLARIRLVFARHSATRAEWDKALEQLRQINIATALDAVEGDEAYVLFGAALQGQKQHRQALEYYARVKPESVHYRTAQLNSAIAYIRQDWWSDAHIAIRNALEQRLTEHDDFTDRLFTTLGFSQLQYGFYRDARESFRNVRVDSTFANRALLGLGVAALHQEDTVGALSAFNHLKTKDHGDMSALESYLLAAYALDKLGQSRTASAAYSEAVAFFQQDIGRCTALRRQTVDDATMESVLAMLLPADREEFQARLIKSRLASQLLQFAQLKDINSELQILATDLDAAVAQHTAAALDRRKQVVESYLSQARFGLARLFDAPRNGE